MLNPIPLAEMRLKAPITLKKKSERLADHVAAVGGNKFRVGRQLILSFAVDSETVGQKLPLSLGLDSRSRLGSSHS